MSTEKLWLGKAIEQKKKELGTLIYHAISASGEPSIKEITTICLEINELSEKAEVIKNRMTEEEKLRCKACGIKLEEESRFCSDCGHRVDEAASSMAVSAFAVQQASKPNTRPVTYAKAPTGKRFLAFLFDSLLIILPLLFYVGPQLDRFSLYVLANQEAGILLDGYFFNTFFIPVMFSMAWLLLLGLWRDGLKDGRSPGKRFFGLMVVKVADNRPCSKGASALRNFLIWFPLFTVIGMTLDPLLVLIHPRGLRLGDVLATTQVIKAADYRQITSK